ncbi:uncharacterized protein LOC130646010 [Hydractinia symbiolongicarpus]|uniref:uncharacterized protein LOC130646010 n=1 Tax=Hydractinia symbiolongicarpus TaxID=13093 RepID=UPI002549D7C7|nr:uncharacterized protein LOC130646010 [Hydractinia symbiolongicarpus]
MADKDLTLRKVVKEIFPTCKLLICLFHTLRSFKREISNQSFNLRECQQVVLKELFQKMCYSKTESEYREQYDLFMKAAPEMVQSYFTENWHDIKNEWVLGDVLNVNSFLNTTNNRLESLNGKLKSVIKLYSPLEDFIDGFFTVLYSLRNERDHKAASTLLKRKVIPFNISTPQYQYSNLLTSYALNFVLNQLKEMKNVGNVHKEGTVFKVRGEMHLNVNTNSCTCSFTTSMLLPCRHIFVVRELEGLPLFDESLCADRWTNDFHRKTHRMFISENFTFCPSRL